MEPFTEVVNLVSFEPLTIFSKRSVLDIWQGSEYAFVWIHGHTTLCLGSSA